MKLRLNHNSIRLRLSMNDVETLSATGMVEMKVPLGVGESSSFKYSIISSGAEEICTNLLNNHLRVHVPEHLLRDWVDTELVGIDTRIKVSEREEIYVLLEKDFQCLTPRPNEDETHNFPNPLNTKC